MQKTSASLSQLFISFWSNKSIIALLIKRDIAARYKGSFLGLLWSFATPVLMLAVYTFVFSVVFEARWSSGESTSKLEFSLLLFIGLMIFNLFAECATKAPGLVLANVNYVKKIVFPLEVLPWVVLGGALSNFIASLLIWLVAYCIFFGLPNWTVIFLPVVLLPLILLIVGMIWILASLGVYVRDINQLIGTFVTILLFLSPIFYPASALPSAFQTLFMLNPLTAPIEAARASLYWGHVPNFTIITFNVVVAFLFFWLGFFWFQKVRKGFADVL